LSTPDTAHSAKPSLTCTWDEESDCLNCEITGKLDCKWEQHLLIRFYKGALPLMIFAVVGFFIVGLLVSWIPAFLYVGFWIFFFGFFETRILCSHCPYYAEEGRILHCLANHGTIKIWKYNPNPLNSFEKVGFLGGALFFVFFPVLTELWGLIEIHRSLTNPSLVSFILLGLILLGITGGFFFFYILRKKICPKCVNFSCPLNKVPKTIVNAYLDKNPVMKEAWLKSGYHYE
jgi:hypothetical protein